MILNYFSYLCGCKKFMKDTFEDIDTNLDGKITLDEFHAYFKNKYGFPPTNEQWIKFHLADKNNNGYITKYECHLFENNTVFD